MGSQFQFAHIKTSARIHEGAKYTLLGSGAEMAKKIPNGNGFCLAQQDDLKIFSSPGFYELIKLRANSNL